MVHNTPISMLGPGPSVSCGGAPMHTSVQNMDPRTLVMYNPYTHTHSASTYACGHNVRVCVCVCRGRVWPRSNKLKALYLFGVRKLARYFMSSTNAAADAAADARSCAFGGRAAHG